MDFRIFDLCKSCPTGIRNSLHTLDDRQAETLRMSADKSKLPGHLFGDTDYLDHMATDDRGSMELVL